MLVPGNASSSMQAGETINTKIQKRDYLLKQSKLAAQWIIDFKKIWNEEQLGLTKKPTQPVRNDMEATKYISQSNYNLTNRHKDQEEEVGSVRRTASATNIPEEILEFQKGALMNQGLNHESGSHHRAQSKQQLRRPVKLGLERHKYNKSAISSSQYRIEPASTAKKEGSSASIYDYESTGHDIKQYLDNQFVPKLASRIEKDKRFGRTGEHPKRNSEHRSLSPGHISDGGGRSSDGDILGSGLKKGSIYKQGNPRVIQVEGKGNRTVYENLLNSSNTTGRAAGSQGTGNRITIYQQNQHPRVGSIGAVQTGKGGKLSMFTNHPNASIPRNITTAPAGQNNINILMQGTEQRGLIATRNTQHAYVAASENRRRA